MKKKTKVILSSLAVIAMSASVASGATYALFTSEQEINVAVNSATVKVVATPKGLETYSFDQPTVNQNGAWTNGGFASVTGNQVSLERVTPGDSASFEIEIENESNVTTQYRLIFDCVADDGLLSGLELFVDYDATDGDDSDQQKFVGFASTDWAELEAFGEVKTLKISLALPETAGDEYQDKTAKFDFRIEAVQGNASTQNFFENNEIHTLNDWKKFASLVNSGANDFEGETVYLMEDIDALGGSLVAVGSEEHPFKGDFVGADGAPVQNTRSLSFSLLDDGNDGYVGAVHTVSNFSVYGTDNVGLFGYVEGSLENVKVENATVQGVNNVGGLVGTIKGSVENCGAEEVKVSASPVEKEGKLTGGAVAGGLIGSGEGGPFDHNTVVSPTVEAYNGLGGFAGELKISTESTIDYNVVENGNLSFVETEEPVYNEAGEVQTQPEDLPENITGKTESTAADGTADESRDYIKVGENEWCFVTILIEKEIAYRVIEEVNHYYILTADGMVTLNNLLSDPNKGNFSVTINDEPQSFNFDGATIVINDDLDMTGKVWTPVDKHADEKGWNWNVIDGKGHTISNLTINGQAMFKRFASFGSVTIKDLTFDHATVETTGINASILTVQTYQNTLLDNVDVKNSSITGAYKVAPLIGSVYDEKETTVTATLKNCDVSNTTVKATVYDFFTCGMIAFVYTTNNDFAVFENCTVTDVKLIAPNTYGYDYHAWIYYNSQDTDDQINEAEGVRVTNVTFELLA